MRTITWTKIKHFIKFHQLNYSGNENLTHHIHNSKGNWVAAPMGTETPMGNCNHSSLRNIMCDGTHINAEHNEENCCLKLDDLPACGFTILRIHPSQNLSRLEENQQGS